MAAVAMLFVRSGTARSVSRLDCNQKLTILEYNVDAGASPWNVVVATWRNGTLRWRTSVGRRKHATRHDGIHQNRT
jgi:hypothetical protein